MTKADIAEIALGARPDALDESVSLANPLTLGRLTGRDTAVDVLRQLATAFHLDKPEFVAQDDERAVVTYVGHAEGHDVGLLVILTPGEGGRYRAVDVYARPWPFVTMVRDKLIAEHNLYRDDIDLSLPYVPDGPTEGYLPEPPKLPKLSADVAFHSPVLTATATGRELVVGRILHAVEEVCGEPHYRIATRFGNSVVGVYDSHVHGHVWQLAAIFGVNADDEINDMRIYSRPWPVAGVFRGEVYKLLRDVLGPEFWQGQHPLVALGEAEA